MPPPLALLLRHWAALPSILQLVTFTVPLALKMPPPLALLAPEAVARFEERVLLVTFSVAVLLLKMAPPLPAELPLIVLSVTFTGPVLLLKMAPPSPLVVELPLIMQPV